MWSRCTHLQTPLPCSMNLKNISNYYCRPQPTTLNSCHCVENDTSLKLFHNHMSCSMLETLQRIILQDFTQHILRDGLPQSLSTSVPLLCQTRQTAILIVTVWKPAWSELNFPKVGTAKQQKAETVVMLCVPDRNVRPKNSWFGTTMWLSTCVYCLFHIQVMAKWLLNDQFGWLCLKRNATGPNEHKSEETDA